MEFENLIRLIDTVSESTLTSFSYEENGVTLKLKKEQEKVKVVSIPAAQADMRQEDSGFLPGAASSAMNAAMSAGAAPSAMNAVISAGASSAMNADSNTGMNTDTDAAAAHGKGEKIVKSPLVGTFYTAPAQDAEPFVAVGDTVKKGQTVAIVEAMKLMNEIESEFDGVVEEILVENEQPVEYGQPLFRLR